MKFVSYNIQYGFGQDGRFDPDRIADSIRDADVIALQEVTRGYSRNGYADLVETFSALFPDYFTSFGPACDVLVDHAMTDGRLRERRFQFGNMVLSRFPIRASRNLLLPRNRTFDKLNLQRGSLEAVIEAPDRALRVYSVHLDHVSPDERLAQIAYLKERVCGYLSEGGALTGAIEFAVTDPPLPEDFLVMGDFNMEPESPEYIAMVGRNDAYYGRAPRAGYPVDVEAQLKSRPADGYSWISEDGSRRMHLDYCFVSGGLVDRLRGCHVDRSAVGSDHFPVWVELAEG
ncbi:endonuclease/exonuclease/phosphatase family protein [Agrobacterium sp. RAC06]|uniref:endonuclease/exonuclease/phosphatase family protein n=1 Tax=Agrobacterium sp. RAC06 TaxID=1842536 RepID=UPI00083CACB8|nr:endonuclease/exonuclease/phosphatase family protein [Agrobacterium sp. RAC06]AOG09398.1 endonuclease/Exonuclease/phosphatase family protein [Agrobacterium sp. RAC06]